MVVFHTMVNPAGQPYPMEIYTFLSILSNYAFRRKKELECWVTVDYRV
jgi:hypothetical protein